VNVLIAGVGHPNLQDLSFGQVLLGHLAKRSWPANVELENLSFGAIAVLQWFQDHPGKFERVVFISAAERAGRAGGTLEIYRWEFPELNEEKVQASVAESVTGIISLDNLLLILQYFEVLPADVRVLEIEPVECEIGFECSPQIAGNFGRYEKIVREQALSKERT